MAREKRASFAALNARLDTFPTEQTILAYFATRDKQIGAKSGASRRTRSSSRNAATAKQATRRS